MGHLGLLGINPVINGSNLFVLDKGKGLKVGFNRFFYGRYSASADGV